MSSFAFEIDHSSGSDEFDFGDKPPNLENSGAPKPPDTSLVNNQTTTTTTTTTNSHELANQKGGFPSRSHFPANTNNNNTSPQNSHNAARFNEQDSSYRRGRARRGRGRARVVSTGRPRHDVATLEAFRNAVCRGDVLEVKHLLEDGVDPNEQLKSNWTAVMYAADSGRVEVLEMLLKHSANSNSQCDMFTALMVCCASRQREEIAFQTAELLLRHRANVNSHDRFRMTPFLYGAKHGHISLLPLLKGKGAHVNKQDMRGWSALCFSAHAGNSDVTRALLECGCDVTLETTQGETAADIAESQGHFQVSEILNAQFKENQAPSLEPGPTPETSQAAVTADQTSHVDSKSQDIPLSTRVANNYVRYGDVELFLMGAELQELIPIFQNQSIGFSDLISMTERDLERAGVRDLGARKKVLGAIKEVHSQEWGTPPILANPAKTITSLEVAGILHNYAKHCAYIRGHLSFIQSQLDSHNDVIETDTESDDAKLVCEALESAVHSSNQLIDTLQRVETHVAKRTGFQVEKQAPNRGVHLGTFLRLGLVSMTGFLSGGSVVFIVLKGTNQIREFIKL